MHYCRRVGGTDWRAQPQEFDEGLQEIEIVILIRECIFWVHILEPITQMTFRMNEIRRGIETTGQVVAKP
jgi:hypothetical protein